MKVEKSIFGKCDPAFGIEMCDTILEALDGDPNPKPDPKPDPNPNPN